MSHRIASPFPAWFLNAAMFAASACRADGMISSVAELEERLAAALSGLQELTDEEKKRLTEIDRFYPVGRNPRKTRISLHSLAVATASVAEECPLEFAVSMQWNHGTRVLQIEDLGALHLLLLGNLGSNVSAMESLKEVWFEHHYRSNCVLYAISFAPRRVARTTLEEWIAAPDSQYEGRRRADLALAGLLAVVGDRGSMATLEALEALEVKSVHWKSTVAEYIRLLKRRLAISDPIERERNDQYELEFWRCLMDVNWYHKCQDSGINESAARMRRIGYEFSVGFLRTKWTPTNGYLTPTGKFAVSLAGLQGCAEAVDDLGKLIPLDRRGRIVLGALTRIRTPQVVQVLETALSHDSGYPGMNYRIASELR